MRFCSSQKVTHRLRLVPPLITQSLRRRRWTPTAQPPSSGSTSCYSLRAASGPSASSLLAEAWDVAPPLTEALEAAHIGGCFQAAAHVSRLVSRPLESESDLPFPDLHACVRRVQTKYQVDAMDIMEKTWADLTDEGVAGAQKILAHAVGDEFHLQSRPQRDEIFGHDSSTLPATFAPPTTPVQAGPTLGMQAAGAGDEARRPTSSTALRLGAPLPGAPRCSDTFRNSRRTCDNEMHLPYSAAAERF